MSHEERDREPTDRQMRASFAELRAEETAQAGSATELLARSAPPRRVMSERPRRVRIAVAATLGAAAAVLLALATGRTREHDRLDPMMESALHSASWRAPTDFLLATPENGLLRTVPRFGPAADWLSSPLDSTRTDPGWRRPS